jgi:DNA-binding NarL/FixJ family response regulator
MRRNDGNRSRLLVNKFRTPRLGSKIVVTMKVFVSDRSPPVRERLVSMISSIAGVEIVGGDWDGNCFTEAVRRLKPAVVVLDVRSDVVKRLAKLRLIKAGKEWPIFVVLADTPSFPYSEKLLSSGADFVFHRSLEFGKLLERIEQLRGAIL